MKIKCLNCGYKWETRSEMIYVNCPSCRKPVRICKIDKNNLAVSLESSPSTILQENSNDN